MADRLDAMFSVFNRHANNAEGKARAIFIAQFGQAKWDEVIAPNDEDEGGEGIMTIFGPKPDFYVYFYVTTVMLIVNGDLDVPVRQEAGA
jgi:hypothetical protein